MIVLVVIRNAGSATLWLAIEEDWDVYHNPETTLQVNDILPADPHVVNTSKNVNRILRIFEMARSEEPAEPTKHSPPLSKPFHTSNSNGAILTIFTTFRDLPRKRHIHKNTIRNYGFLRPHIIPVMYYTPEDTGLVGYGLKYGWDYHPVPKASSRGVPVLRTMFLHAQDTYNTTYYAYTNSDILYDFKLIDTLKELEENMKSLSQVRFY